VTPTSGCTIAATFSTQYALAINSLPSAGGSVNPAVGVHWYDPGTSVALSVTSAQGYQFSGWILDGSYYSGSNYILETTNSAHGLTAIFSPSSFSTITTTSATTTTPMYSGLYQMAFSETGLPTYIGFCWTFWACIPDWSVMINGQTLTASDSSRLIVNEPSGSYSYQIQGPSGESSLPSSGSVWIGPASNEVSVKFYSSGSTPPSSTEDLHFTESGLPQGSTWWVELYFSDGQQQSNFGTVTSACSPPPGGSELCAASQITFGSVPTPEVISYCVFGPYGYTPELEATSGTLTYGIQYCNTDPTSIQSEPYVNIGWQPGTYSVSVLVSGLGSGYTWSAVIGGETAGPSSGVAHFNLQTGAYPLVIILYPQPVPIESPVTATTPSEIAYFLYNSPNTQLNVNGPASVSVLFSGTGSNCLPFSGCPAGASWKVNEVVSPACDNPSYCQQSLQVALQNARLQQAAEYAGECVFDPEFTICYPGVPYFP